MTPRSLVPLAVACLWFATSGQAQDSPIAEISQPAVDPDGRAGFEALLSSGYTPLFNGKDLTGWRNPYAHGEAEVVDGEIHLKANDKFFLVTEKPYSDFIVSAEIHLPEGPANSGVMFRCHVDDAKKRVFGYQAECDGSERRWSGGLYDEGRRGWIWPSTAGRSEPEFLEKEEESKAFFARPEIRNALNRNGWNRFVVTCIQDQITIELNGVKTVSLRDATDASGYIGIQHHGEDGQTYRFRNIFIKELPVVPAEKSVSLTEEPPVAIQRISPSTILVDFGYAAFGNLALGVPDNQTGDMQVHFGEHLTDGRIDRQPPGTVRYGVSPLSLEAGTTDRVVVPAPVDARNTEQVGAKAPHPPAVLTPEAWGPVMPFRWVEIEGWPGELTARDIARRAAYASDWNEHASAFECSDATLNQVWNLCKHSIKATTFAGVYVDGDRERIPYEADAYLNQLSHYATDDHVTMAARTFDWLMEHPTWPTEWAPHMVFMAHAEWMDKGDTEWLSQRYESLKTKTLLNRAGDDGLVRSGEADRKRNDIVDWPTGERDAFVFTSINTVVNAFHIEAMERMAELARAVGKDDDARAFEARVTLATSSFQETLFNDATGLYRDGVGTDHSSAHANFFPLAFGLVPAEKVAGIVAWLGGREMPCSVYAAQYLLDGLFQNGGEKQALALIVASGDRSWKHMVESGTTITWEAWDQKYKPNQDWNHAWGAAPANLLPRHILGVQPAAPGWSTTHIRPQTAGLASASGTIPTPLGPIAIQWNQGASFEMNVDLPAGMTARIDVPASEGSTGVTVNSQAAAATRDGDRWTLAQALSGSAAIRVLSN